MKKKAFGFVAIGLVAGLALGSLGIATAATAISTETSGTTATSTAPATGEPPDVGPGGPRGLEGRGAGDIAEALANLSDLSVSEIQQKRRAGTSYAAIAKAEGVGSDKLIAETIRIETAELDAEVKAGTLTAAQRAQVLGGLEEFLKTEIESTEARGHHGPGGPADASADANASGTATQ